MRARTRPCPRAAARSCDRWRSAPSSRARRRCAPRARRPPAGGGDSRPVRAALEQVCARAIKAGPLKGAAAREFFEANFVPVRIRKLGEAAGFLTGYYEPIVDGSRFPTREFSVPLYRRPPDLTAPGLADGAAFPNTGKAFRRTAERRARPLLRPRRDRGRRARRPAPRDLLGAQPDRCAVHRHRRLGTDPARGRHHDAHQLRCA